MPVPEASMHEVDAVPFSENKSRAVRQFRRVQSISKPEPVEGTSELLLRLGVRTPDRRHIPASGSAIMNVCHQTGIPA